MKKFLPILAITGVGLLLTGCNNMTKSEPNNLKDNIDQFEHSVEEYSNLNKDKVTKIANRYNLSIFVPVESASDKNQTNENKNLNISELELSNSLKEQRNETVENKENNDNINNSASIKNADLSTNQNLSTLDINNDNSDKMILNLSPITREKQSDTSINDVTNNENISTINDKGSDFSNAIIERESLNQIMTLDLDDSNDEIFDLEDEANNENEINNIDKLSTLYSITDDISTSTDEFLSLKQKITSAIVETETLITKYQNKEIELTNEQKMFIIEQSTQLKNLGRELSKITTELNFNLKDISSLMNNNTSNIDQLSMKYLIVLDNLVNGNEMLENSLYSINLMNSLFNSNRTMTPNNYGRILYGFQRNNEQPIIKDYMLDNDGNFIDNSNNQDNTNESIDNMSIDSVSETDNNNTNGNIDTYSNRRLASNIDTYRNYNSNIDTFFNTALLDNEFMYGSRGNGFGYGMNPYGMNGYENQFGRQGYMQPYNNSYNNTTDGVNTAQYTQNERGANTENSNIDNSKAQQHKREKKRLTKNIDTYRNDNTPTLSTKFTNLKEKVGNTFSRFSKSGKKNDDKIKNPIYKFDSENE